MTRLKIGTVSNVIPSFLTEEVGFVRNECRKLSHRIRVHCVVNRLDSSFSDDYNEIMRVHFKPTTNLGSRSAWLILIFAVSLATFGILVASGQRGGATFFSNPTLTIPALIAATAGIAAFITGLISIARRRERSVSVFLGVGFGLITLVFVLGEIIFPH